MVIANAKMCGSHFWILTLPLNGVIAKLYYMTLTYFFKVKNLKLLYR